jgi:hypothetical protein
MFSTSIGNPGRRFTSFLKVEHVLLICVVVGTLLAVFRSIPLIVSPYQIDYGEGLMLEGALRMSHAQPLYTDPFTFPVVLHEYGPVAYAAGASVLPNGAASFPAGRILILVCSVAVSLLLGVILRRLTGSWWIGLSFGFLLLTLPAFRIWSYLFRADVIGIVFSMTGIALYLLHDKRQYWSIPFFLLALFCKYTLIAAPVAVFIHLFLNRKTKRAFAFAAGLGLASALTFIVIQIGTGGWFAIHMFSIHPDPYSLTHFLVPAVLIAASAPVVTALAAWYATLDFREGKRSFLPIYFVVSSLTALTAGKLGANRNHFIEWMVASCMCAGMGYFLMLSKHYARAVQATVLLGASILVGVVAQNRLCQQAPADMVECDSAYRYVKDSSSSQILSENLGPLLAGGKPVLVSDPFVYGQLVKHGLWPDRRVEELVSEHYFGLIVMSSDPSQMKAHGSETWPESLVNAIDRNYRTVNRFTCRDAGVMLEPVSPQSAH